MVRFTNSGNRIPSIIPRVRLTEGWRKKLSRENATSPVKVHPEPQQRASTAGLPAGRSWGNFRAVAEMLSLRARHRAAGDVVAS